MRSSWGEETYADNLSAVRMVRPPQNTAAALPLLRIVSAYQVHLCVSSAENGKV